MKIHSSLPKRPQQGFTLIELLIVVAIIAILAAIAVPNFSEAQAKSKVARAKADVRSLVTAIESYRVDENKYPPSNDAQVGDPYKPLRGNPALDCLTKPVSYITAVNLRDPFNNTAGNGFLDVYGYSSRDKDGIVMKSDAKSAVWYVVTSMGPQGKLTDYKTTLDANDTVGFMNCQYDPTNGVPSTGNIFRVGGQVTGVGSAPVYFVRGITN